MKTIRYTDDSVFVSQDDDSSHGPVFYMNLFFGMRSLTSRITHQKEILTASKETSYCLVTLFNSQAMKESYKYLGTITDDKLNFEENICVKRDTNCL